jgi:hypothetical protein
MIAFPPLSFADSSFRKFFRANSHFFLPIMFLSYCCALHLTLKLSSIVIHWRSLFWR